MFAEGILKFQKWFQDFKLGIDVDILVFLATFSKNWAKFDSIFWSHCLQMLV
jgi:hypothetical protein